MAVVGTITIAVFDMTILICLMFGAVTWERDVVHFGAECSLATAHDVGCAGGRAETHLRAVRCSIL